MNEGAKTPWDRILYYWHAKTFDFSDEIKYATYDVSHKDTRIVSNSMTE